MVEEIYQEPLEHEGIISYCQSEVDRRLFLGKENSGDNDCNDAAFQKKRSPIHLDCFIGCDLEEISEAPSSVKSLTMGSLENDEELLSGIIKAASSRLRRKCIDDKLIATIAGSGAVGWTRHSQIEIGNLLGVGSFSNVFEIKSLRSNAGGPKSKRNHDGKSRSISKKKEDINQSLKCNRLVIKILKPSLIRKPSVLSMCTADLVKEGAILASLGMHPHIVTLVALTPTGLGGFRDSSNGIRHDAFFLVLSRLEKSLEDQLNEWRGDKGELKVNLTGANEFLLERFQIMVDLASAIQHVHSKGIIHRDLKPNNIGFDASGILKLFDFDVARIIPKDVSTKSSSFRSRNDENETFLLTQHVGTQRYMSPECARGERYNTKADVYSFGLLFHEVLSLELPFSKTNDAEEHYQSVYLEHLRPSLPKNWPKSLRNFIRNCWSDSISSRPTMEKAFDFLSEESQNLIAGFDKKRKNYSVKGFLRKRVSSIKENPNKSNHTHKVSLETSTINDSVTFVCKNEEAVHYRQKGKNFWQRTKGCSYSASCTF